MTVGFEDRFGGWVIIFLSAFPDQTKRLGTVQLSETGEVVSGGADDIKKHPFFRNIDWAKLERVEIEPPWKPVVKDAADTRNIAAEFTNEPAAVTPSPMGSRLRDMTGGTPPSFTDFTFTHNSTLGDGQTYRVSFSGACGGGRARGRGSAVRGRASNYKPTPLLFPAQSPWTTRTWKAT